MNAVEIGDAVADLAAAPFDAAEFPYQFLKAFDKKETQLKRLKKGDTNRSDVPGGVLLQANIHMAVCPPARGDGAPEGEPKGRGREGQVHPGDGRGDP